MDTWWILILNMLFSWREKSLKAAYPVMTEKVDRILIRRYCHILDEKKARYVEEMPRENSFHSIMLGDALARTFRQDQWQDLIDSVSSLNPLPSPRPFQKGKGCNRSCSSLLTASLYGWRGIRVLARVLRDGTALQKGASDYNIWHQRSCYGCFGGDAPAGDEGNEKWGMTVGTGGMRKDSRDCLLLETGWFLAGGIAWKLVGGMNGYKMLLKVKMWSFYALIFGGKECFVYFCI